MLVSWDWLKEYVDLDMPVEELERRLMMAGLNHEETTRVGDDTAINFEVTSNRSDCLGHLGIAREIAVLWNRPLKIPAAAPPEGKMQASKLARVDLECPELCPRYTARVIRGAKVGPSPKWLANRLATVGIAAINNVVDITNYELLECGQPLHAFDLAKLAGGRIIVRRARPGEQFQAINHRTYTLEPQMCVIANAQQAVAIGGVMGGADTEVTTGTSELLIESAQFDPISIRNTARRLNLHSDSSYRFERSLDPAGVDWASRRCCEMILEIAGGELAAGMIDVGNQPGPREPVELRFAQLRRNLGIDVDPAEARRILHALGASELRGDRERVEVIPPTWRRDLSREIDLVEEVARIHGYDKIPEDVSVPMATSHRSDEDRVLAKVRQVVTAAGFDEAMTLSAVEEQISEAYSPWTSAPPLTCQTPVLRRADRLRRSIVPSLLDARRINESLTNPEIELFEIATAYLPSATPGALPDEPRLLALASSRDYFVVKGVIEAILAAVNPRAELGVEQSPPQQLLDPARSCQLRLRLGEKNELLGYLGELSPAGLKQFDLRGLATVAEIKLTVLLAAADLVPKYVKQSSYPAVSRDLNLVVDEPVRWADVQQTVSQAAAPYLERLEHKQVYRDPDRIGPGKKSFLLSVQLRSQDGTLTSEEANRVRDAIGDACRQKHGAELRV